ncbi:MAG TPA: endonuclease/exonuclease/phosphatase family protein [Verrucomicrobiales bacterium]|nr:endonuclease/exonuclease/phosphatase family protein [Verrucomicrobiales bacterium]
MKQKQTVKTKQSYRNTIKLLIAILLVLTGLKNSEILQAQDSNQKSKVAPPIKVMSFNIRYGKAKDGENHWKNRFYLVAETIKMFDPDLLGTQEVLKFQAEFLQELLPEYSFHGVGRQDGTDKGEYVPVMYKKDRFQLNDSGHFWLSETPDIPGSKSWDSSLPRMASWVILNDLKNGGATFAFGNTHFDHRGRTARLESARLIRERIEQAMDEDFPVILTGDFNTTEDLLPYEVLMTGSEGNRVPLLDSFRQTHPERSPNESSTSRWIGNRKGNRIDWILHTEEFTTLQSVINYTNEKGRYPSDHYPVQAILRLKK